MLGVVSPDLPRRSSAKTERNRPAAVTLCPCKKRMRFGEPSGASLGSPYQWS